MLRSTTKTLLKPSKIRSLATSSSSTNPNIEQPSADDKALEQRAQAAQATSKSTKHQTVAEQDAELMRKLAGHSDEGGAAGVEYEDGKPVAMKRGVKNNMFRLI